MFSNSGSLNLLFARKPGEELIKNIIILKNHNKHFNAFIEIFPTMACGWIV